MEGNTRKLTYILTLLLLLLPIGSSAVTNDILLSSAKEIVLDWTTLLSQEHREVNGEYGSWGVYRSSIVGPLSYDIQKTSSIVSPYVLIISGKAKWDHNFASKRADVYSEVYEMNYGFSTEEKAIQNTSEDDFGNDIKKIYDFKIFYSYQEGSWIFKNANSDFNSFLLEDTSKDIKASLEKYMSYKVE